MKTNQEANEFLESEYLTEHNRRFGHEAAAAEDYHRPAPSRAELDEIFRLETDRVIGNDWVVRYQNRYLQVKHAGRQYAPARAKVVVWEWPDGRVGIEYRGRAVRWREIAAPAKPREPQAAHRRSGTPTPTRAKGKWVPPADHPWRQAALQGSGRKVSSTAGGAMPPSRALPSASP